MERFKKPITTKLNEESELQELTQAKMIEMEEEKIDELALFQKVDALEI